MRRRPASRCRRIAATVLLAYGALAWAQPADPKLGPMLRELGRESARVTTLRAHFVQEKHVAIVRDVLRSSGTFLLDKHGRIAWDVREPEPVRIVIRKDGVFADGKRVGAEASEGAGASFSPLPLLESLNQIFGGISEETERDFEVERLGDDRLRLKPRSAALGAWLVAMEITLDSKTRTPARIRLEEPGGDRTEITLSDVSVNPELDDAAFAP